ncbi:uncharacterized protein LY89DRAFT_504491 [Mollisia scopiformis]|uniref:Ethyl tert-butyl ether degradation EthD n=1 Tax=Mollisia scopiformis TaxID=149040 RepID=A0A194XEZ8_MOLSC|nr:uncharacterized protein LY89DRAFT_504491 [Mollisia scopiformis]KUJ18765.1 hypothetical protein LY89DRAFT_504491 [Mollisia scopiformis]
MASQEIVVTLLYPATEKFDMNYYLTSHMATVEKQFTPTGLTKWQVVKAAPDTGYSTVCHLWFKSKEAADECFASAGNIMADIPNYTDVKPVTIGGQVVGGN